MSAPVKADVWADVHNLYRAGVLVNLRPLKGQRFADAGPNAGTIFGVIYAHVANPDPGSPAEFTEWIIFPKEETIREIGR